MNRNRFLYLIFIIIVVVLLSACAGGGVATQSWPGLTVDVEAGTAYLAHKTHVYAVNLDNGTQKWRFPVEPDNKITFFAPPALTEDGQLIVGSYDKVLYSLNPENGQQNWTFDGSQDLYIAGPLVNGERIYAPSSDSNLYVLDYDGELLWTFGTEFEQWATPSIEGNTLYLPSMDHVVYALDAQSGDLLWTSEDLGGALAGTPPFEEQSALYIGTLNSEMVALNNQNGEILWRIPTEGWVWSGPALDKDVLYFGDMTGTFYSIDANSGSNNWQPYMLGSENKQGITGTPLVTEDTIYIGSENGVFTALNSDGGSLRWSKTIDGKLFQGPVSADDLILIAPADSDPVLIAMDYDGNQKWAFVPQK